VDQPGVVIGRDAENAGTIRTAVRVLQAIDQSRVPWIAIVLRKALALPGPLMAGSTILISVMPGHRGDGCHYPLKAEYMPPISTNLKARSGPEESLCELEDYYEQLEYPFRTAEKFGMHDIIDPRQIRPLLCDWVEQAYEVLPQQLGPTLRMMRV
jgi:acetyl-CoA carboxylase carboxyltransferase component